MLPKYARLKSRRLFAKALNPQLGHKLGSSPFFTLLGVPHSQEYLDALSSDSILPSARFGLIVSKKVDKRAVVRNRLKRRYREVLRVDFIKNQDKLLNKSKIQQYRAVVIIVRQPSIQAPFQTIRKALLKHLFK